MKTIKKTYNLQTLTQLTEANLSDLFIILASMFLIEKNKGVPSTYSLNKLFPYIFNELESQRKLDELSIFNLPFYRMKGGHYNQSLGKKYMKKLIQAGLVKQLDKECLYSLNLKAKKLIEEYFKEKQNDQNVKAFINMVGEFTIKFLKGKNYNQVQNSLYCFSHNLIVEDQGEKICVDQLKITSEDNIAISYNNENFEEGQRSDLVPRPYITKLAYELQENEPINEKTLEIAKKMFAFG